jgi:shikimate dehydrogenase
MGDTNFFAVAGDPILHSRSPEMFRAAFKATSLNAVYLRFAASEASEIARMARSMPIHGFNITSPYKEKILPFLDDIDEAALRSGAVNTMVLDKGKLVGFNTDIDGVREALLGHGIAVRGKKALVLGAGGAAKAAALALISQGARVTLINRTPERAREIARTFSCKAAPVKDISQEMDDTDILVSCISESGSLVPRHCLRKDLVVLDAHYRVKTPLARDAKAKECTVIDGREWLLFQGASAFRHFTGLKPPLPAMRSALYDDNGCPRKNIALIGFMGTGKSTVSRHLAENLKMAHIDIDDEIERKNASSITDIFKNLGEESFRRMEEMQIDAAARMPGRIISCGGGAVLNKASIERLRLYATVVWLSAGVGTILQRVGSDRSRPLLNVQDRRSEIEKMLRLRTGYYARACDLIINTDGKEPEEIAQRIYDEINTSLER